MTELTDLEARIKVLEDREAIKELKYSYWYCIDRGLWDKIGDVFADTIIGHGYAVFAWPEFESRIRGGQNSYSIQISEKPQNAPHMSADVLMALNQGALDKYEPQLKEEYLQELDIQSKCSEICLVDC